MRRLEVQVPAPDGRSDGTLHLPDGDGPWPDTTDFKRPGQGDDRALDVDGPQCTPESDACSFLTVDRGQVTGFPRPVRDE